jgi:hypothetical protein
MRTFVIVRGNPQKICGQVCGREPRQIRNYLILKEKYELSEDTPSAIGGRPFRRDSHLMCTRTQVTELVGHGTFGLIVYQ